MPKKVRAPLLGQLETAVMEHLWDGGLGEAKSVHAGLGKRRGITLSTVQSTMKRLFEKGLLERIKVSHAHVYRPSKSREQFRTEALAEMASDIMQGHASVMVAAFVDLTERAGPEHLARLETLVAERRRELDKERKK